MELPKALAARVLDLFSLSFLGEGLGMRAGTVIEYLNPLRNQKCYGFEKGAASQSRSSGLR
jgi:hypothetical protein